MPKVMLSESDSSRLSFESSEGLSVLIYSSFPFPEEEMRRSAKKKGACARRVPWANPKLCLSDPPKNAAIKSLRQSSPILPGLLSSRQC